MAQLVGTAANQVSVNGMLGTAAFVDIPQLPVNGSHTATGDVLISGYVSVMCSDGVVRKLATVT